MHVAKVGGAVVLIEPSPGAYGHAHTGSARFLFVRIKTTKKSQRGVGTCAPESEGAGAGRIEAASESEGEGAGG